MLRPDEFFAGDIAAHSGNGITLVLPRGQYEHAALIGQGFDKRFGVVLNGDLPGQAFPVVPDDEWPGIIVHDVGIEVDERSAFDPLGGLEPGAVIREEDQVSIAGVVGGHPRMGRAIKILLARDLPRCDPLRAVAFRKWRIVIGEAEDKRELLSVDAQAFAKTRAATIEAGRG